MSEYQYYEWQTLTRICILPTGARAGWLFASQKGCWIRLPSKPAVTKTYTASNYDHATSLLDQIQQLADFQGTQNNFDARVKLLAEKYKARTALIGRWKRKGWV